MCKFEIQKKSFITHSNQYSCIDAKTIVSRHSCNKVSFFSGLDEEIIGCWMQSLEDILETNKEAVEKAKKYDFLKNDMENLNTKISSLSKSYADNPVQSDEK